MREFVRTKSVKLTPKSVKIATKIVVVTGFYVINVIGD